MKRYRGPLLTLLGTIGLGLALVAVNGGGEAPPVPAAQVAPAEVGPTPTALPAPVTVETVEKVETAFAGRTSGGEATIAIAIKDGRAVAYLCDGKKVEAWLEGTVEGSSLKLSGKNGVEAAGEIAAGVVNGTVTTAAAQWAFVAEQATAPAGTYRGDVSVAGVQKRIGWNVLRDGSVTGLVRDASGVAPAPPLDLTDRTASLDGAAVSVAPVTGADSIN